MVALKRKYSAGWVIDGSGSLPEKDMLIAVEDGHIRSLDRAAVSGQRGDRILDFSDCTLLPGLIDAHVHLFMSGTHDQDIRERQLVAGFDAVKGDISRRLKSSLDNGIVAVRDGGDRHGHALTHKRAYLDSRVNPISVFTAGRAWRRSGRYGRLIGRGPGQGNTLAKAIKISREQVDHVKIVNSGLNSLVRFGKQTLPQFTLEELKAAVAAAKERGLNVMVHANGKVPVDIAVRAGCDSIEHGFFMGRDNLARMADQQTVWVPTAVTMQAYIAYMQNRAVRETSCHARDGAHHPVEGARRNLDHQLEQMAMARQMGVRVAVGTDAGSPGVDHGRSLQEEIGLFMQAGYSISEAVRSATRISARLLNMGDAGRLAAGAAATFVAVKGSPADLPRSFGRIKGLIINGKQII